MSQKAMWMVRAGEGGFRLEEFKTDALVSIGWPEVGDMSRYQTRADFTRAMEQALPGAKAGQVAHRQGRRTGLCRRSVWATK
jgi:predicted Mrr-cat superfamily restriction endonuclease